MSQSLFTKNTTIHHSAVMLVLFIIIEKIIENAILVPLLTVSPLSEINSNLLYKAIEIALVIGLNYLLIRQSIYLKLNINIRFIIFTLLAILYFSLWTRVGPQDQLLKVSIWTLLAAISEELLFRGVILGNLLKIFIKKGKPSRTQLLLVIVITSLIFSLEHLSNLANQSVMLTICQLIQTFGMGFLLAALYIRTGSLLYPICLHFLIDFPSLYLSQASSVPAGSTAKVSVIGSIIVALIYMLAALVISKSFDQDNRLVTLVANKQVKS